MPVTVETILAAVVPDEVVAIAEWGGTVTVRGLTKADADEVRRASTDATGRLDEPAWERAIFRASVVDPLFTAEQVDALFTAGAATAINRVLEAVFRVNGLGEAAREASEQSFREGSDSGKKR